MRNLFEKSLEESIDVKTKCLAYGYKSLNKLSVLSAETLAKGGKLLFCGNGGSAADAQHLVAELLVRFRSKFNRCALPALTLAQDTSTLTACGNDLGFDKIYSRVLEAVGSPEDILIILSTSGNSSNVIQAIDMAKKKNIYSFGFLGGDGGLLKNLCDDHFIVPSSNTARIQEVHITLGHALMQDIEEKLIACNFLVSY